jgi:N-acetylmuramoyl-L-alanine amidase
VKLSDGRVGWVSGYYVDRASSPGAGGSLARKVIAIDPGHGGSDPGAVGVTGLQEKVVNLDVGLRVASKLRSLGARVVLTRDTDVFIPLAQRPAIAQAAGAHVYVSVHSNAHPSAQIGGTETYYYSNASRGLASHMQRRLVAALDLRDIGTKYGNFLVIRQASMPAVLLELGFLSNVHEESLLRTDGFRQKAADAIVQALLDYFR